MNWMSHAVLAWSSRTMKSRDGQTADNKDSWLNNWPVRGRTSYPLLFDRSGQAKQAFEAVVQVAADNGKK